jgi:hypothetical protein
MYVPAGGTGRYQVNDTHMHKPMKGHAQFVAGKWYTSHMMTLNQKRWPKPGSSRQPITLEEYEGSVRELMSTQRLRDMTPRWLNIAVKHISQPIPGEERSIIKKGWDQPYLEPIAQEGFLEVARAAQVVAMEERRKQQRVLIFQEQTAWMAQHGNIDDFVPSWERPEHVELAPLAQEVLEVTHSEKIWHERYQYVSI